MPVWWPNDVFEWTALKNLSHRYDGQLGDSYSNCLRLAIVQGYEFYNKVSIQDFNLAEIKTLAYSPLGLKVDKSVTDTFSLQDPYNFTEENGEDLPTVAAIKRVKLALNPQVLLKLCSQAHLIVSSSPGVCHDSAV